MKERNVNEPLKLSSLAALVCAQPKHSPKCAMFLPTALWICHNSAMNCITGVPGRECFIK